MIVNSEVAVGTTPVLLAEAGGEAKVAVVVAHAPGSTGTFLVGGAGMTAADGLPVTSDITMDMDSDDELWAVVETTPVTLRVMKA